MQELFKTFSIRLLFFSSFYIFLCIDSVAAQILTPYKQLQKIYRGDHYVRKIKKFA